MYNILMCFKKLNYAMIMSALSELCILEHKFYTVDII